MPKILQTWTVLPHGPLEEIDDGLLTVTGDIPMPLRISQASWSASPAG